MKILSKNGYSILKSDIDENTLNKIRNDLNVKPQINFDNGIPVTSFKIYKENNIRIFLPQNYGYKMFGKPDIIKIKSGKEDRRGRKGSVTQEDKKPPCTFLSCAPCGDSRDLGILGVCVCVTRGIWGY